MNRLTFPAAAPSKAATAALQHLAAVTAELELRIQQVTSRFPPHHLSHPKNGERFNDREGAYTRLQDYASSMGFAIGVCSSRADRIQYECAYHEEDTRNWRNINLRERKRVHSNAKAKGCKWAAYIS